MYITTYFHYNMKWRKKESVSEAVNAYDAIALYGDAMAKAWDSSGEAENAAIARKIRDTGRVMLATEIEAARSYWQVCEGDCGNLAPRIYPLGYKPKVVGQVWSVSAEMQTWFGSAPWKVRVYFVCICVYLCLFVFILFYN
jgi:hypothetical protein